MLIKGEMMMKATQLEWNSLYEAAHEFANLKPWEWMSEYQLLVVEDPKTHIKGFCCILGNHSDAKGLKVYPGIEGLRYYIDMLEANQLTIEDKTVEGLLSRETCLSVGFKEAGTIHFRDSLIGFVPTEVTDEWQCQFLMHALKQVCELAKLIKNTPSFILEEDQVLMRLQEENLNWKTLKLSLSVFLEQLNETKPVYEDELMAYRISKLPSTDMVFEITQFLMPRPIEEKASRAYYPMITAVLEQKMKQLVFVEMSDPSVTSQELIVGQFAQTLLKDLEFKPQCLVTDCEAVFRQFSDFSAKTKIPLQKVNELESASEFISDLMNIEEHMNANRNDDIDETIDLILSTSKEICQSILGSDTLSSHLSETVKNQFSNVVELFHVVMLGHFKELPDHWSEENVTKACKEILPTLLTEEELKIVPDILTHYLDVVGEAEVIPNYLHLQKCVTQSHC